MLNFVSWSKRSEPDLRYLPGAVTTFATMMVCMMCHDFIFYHGHRTLHHPKLYKHIHKKHHEWQAPIAAAATYANPLEHIVTWIFSASAGLMIMAAPIPVIWVWYCWLGFQVQSDHSGYHFPLMFSPEFHDYHHLKYILFNCLGTFNVVR
jgi:sterol desaturase/sphingolipid hydroxylase (fatty acid hydroxylase superfamily)